MKTFITDNKEYENISGWKNVYIYVSGEVANYLFSKNMRIYQVEKTYIFMYSVKLPIMYFQPWQLQLLGAQFHRRYYF